MSVMSVNSYYDNAVNGLFITAGMLQKPFFDADYDMARNFGGVGAIMGHELTHGFDNTGRKYDQNSRLKVRPRSSLLACLRGTFRSASAVGKRGQMRRALLSVVGEEEVLGADAASVRWGGRTGGTRRRSRSSTSAVSASPPSTAGQSPTAHAGDVGTHS
eukprot:592981-Rhodomonas_salina.1